MMRSSLLSFSATLALLSTAAFGWLYDNTPVDCLQSPWSDWMKVGFGDHWRTRVTLRHPSNGGAACGAVQEGPLPSGEEMTAEDTAKAFDKFFLQGQTDDQRSRSPDKMRDLLIILDESGSIGSGVFDRAKEELADMLGYLCPCIGETHPCHKHDPHHQVAFMTFGTQVREHFDFDHCETYNDVKTEIMNVGYTGGGTNTHLALDYARTTMFNNGNFRYSTKGLRTDTLKEVLLITDGHPNSNSLTVTAARNLRNIGVDVFALGIGDIDQDHIELIVSDPEFQHIFHVNSFGDFHNMTGAVEASYSGGEPCVSLNPWDRRRR